MMAYKLWLRNKINMSTGKIMADNSKCMCVRNIYDLPALIRQLKPIKIERIFDNDEVFNHV